MNKYPHDPSFNKMLRMEVELGGRQAWERVLFIDHDNQIRHAIYKPEFDNGILGEVRERLEKAGLLKAVVHISVNVPTHPSAVHTRTTVVEYLPDGRYYRFLYAPARMTGAAVVGDEPDIQTTKSLFHHEEG